MRTCFSLLACQDAIKMAEGQRVLLESLCAVIFIEVVVHIECLSNLVQSNSFTNV